MFRATSATVVRPLADPSRDTGRPNHASSERTLLPHTASSCVAIATLSWAERMSLVDRCADPDDGRGHGGPAPVTSAGLRILRLQFGDPAFQGVDVLIEVENRSHRYAHVPTVPLELEPTDKLLLSLRLTTLPHTRNVHLLMIAKGPRRGSTGLQALVC